MATTSLPHRWKYDVFVSFRGEDIRKNFMDHLFNDFKQKGIYAFKDDDKLPKGEEISPHLYKAIEESRFLIVIFSKNYASSTWCLRELVKILECKQIEKHRHEVRIIFYDVKPDVVRKQKGSYAEAFRNHVVSNSAEVGKWKEALSMAADLSGFDLQGMTNGYESKFIDCISNEILKKLCDGPLHVGENLVGIDLHFDKLDLSRFVGSDKVNMIGICDVKEVTNRQGLTQVQLHMIGKIMKIEDLKISSVGEGVMVIKKMRSHGVDEIHDMKFLDEDQSLQLFGSYAFKTKDSSKGFKEVAEEVVKYVQGHPLAIKVLARFLYGKTVGQWVSELDQLKVHPNRDIQQVLRLSYDGLNLHQQYILLDIACSFIGVNSDFAATVLDGCNFFAYTNIQVLVDKSLITISSNNLLQMHDLIQAMAKGIVFEESSMPGNRSRLWVNPSEIYNILSEKKATEVVEVLDIVQMKTSQKFDIDGKAFARMKNLRILKLPIDRVVKFSGRLDCLSNNLRLLYWYGCPFKLLPSDFYPENIVVIDLSYSNIKQLWTTPKLLSAPGRNYISEMEEWRLRWFGHAKRRPQTTPIKRIKALIVVSFRRRSRLKLRLSADGQDFFTLHDEVTETFDAMGLLENLLRGIYAY
nr:NB-ARC domains-containing protein [Tanacetum cinerariifolium]